MLYYIGQPMVLRSRRKIPYNNNNNNETKIFDYPAIANLFRTAAKGYTLKKLYLEKSLGSCKLGGRNTGVLVLLQILEEKVYQYCYQYFPVLLYTDNTGTIPEDTGN